MRGVRLLFVTTTASLSAVLFGVGCNEVLPYAVIEGKSVRCLVLAEENGCVTRLSLRTRIGKEVFEELLVFDVEQRMTRMKTIHYLQRPNPKFDMSAPRETWIGNKGNWRMVVLKSRMPSQVPLFAVIERPPVLCRKLMTTNCTAIWTTEADSVVRMITLRQTERRGNL